MTTTTRSKIIHRANSRGLADHGWLRSRHTFSFANYYDPERIRFGLLRVLNDDMVAPGMGFGMHSHDNMEIVSIPLSGALEHKDSTGHQQVIHEGEVQIMSAGSGIAHSEFNHSKEEAVNFLQIWIFPKERNITPRYEQKAFDLENQRNQLVKVVSPHTDDDALWINQDAWYHMGLFDSGRTIKYDMNKTGNGLYVFVIEGGIEVAGETLKQRDAIGLQPSDTLFLKTTAATRLLLIEVPMG